LTELEEVIHYKTTKSGEEKKQSLY